MNTKFLKGVIGRESAEGSSMSAVASLCRALRQHDIAAPVLFQQHAAGTIFSRGDVIGVKRTTHHRVHSQALVLSVDVERGALSYFTTVGGPFNALHCTLVKKAGSETLADAEDAETWAPSTSKARPERKSSVKHDAEFNKVRALVKAEFKDSLDKSKGLSEFLAGRASMATAFAHNAEKYTHGSREFEIGENLGSALEDHYEMFGTGDEVFSTDLTPGVMSLKLDDFVTWVIGVVKAHKEKLKIAVEHQRNFEEALTEGEYYDKSDRLDLKTPTKSVKEKKAEKKAVPFDNSHNHGFRGRLNQRVVDEKNKDERVEGDWDDTENDW